MPEIVQQLRSFYADLEPAKRRVLLAATALGVMLILGVSIWAAQPRYVSLTTPADVDERTDITEALSRASIAWRVGSDGSTIEVLAEDQTRALSAAASDRGIVGLEGLEQIDPWATPFVELLQKQRMLQGEIVRTVNRMDGIARSACLLNLPAPSDFIGRTSHPTAAVSLTPDVGSSITHETARSVAEFVSHAVTGMSADDVSVVDTSTGRTLWSGAAVESAQESADSAEGRREAELSAKVNAVLLSLFGSPDNYSVAVKVQISTATVESLTNSVDPDSAAPMVEHIESEKNGSSAGGIPGTDSNIPERAGGSSATSRSSERQETTYQYTRTQTTTSQPAGELKHLSASVVINSEALATLVKGGTLDEAAQKANIEKIVKAALGASTERGDSVVVEVAAFAPRVATVLPEVAPTSVDAALDWAPPAVALITIILVLVLGVRPLLKAVTSHSPPAAVAAAPAANAANREPLLSADGEEVDEAGNVIDLDARLRRHVDGYQKLDAKHLSALVAKETEHSAEVLRRWMRG